MILTDKFTFIHLPKTGGTFVQKVLWDVYENNKSKSIKFHIDIMLRRRFIKKKWINDIMPYMNGPWGQHGGISCMPTSHKNKKVLSVIRDPFKWYYSLYDFRWWEKYADISDNVSFKKHKSYPNLTFNEMMETYQDLVSDFGRNIKVDLTDIGYYTWYFIMMYIENPVLFFQNPDFRNINLSNLLLQRDINFIRQENLNSDLFEFLKSENYTNIDFIKNLELILPNGRGRGDVNFDAKEVLCSSDINLIKSLDKMIFNVFPDYTYKFELEAS